MAVSPKAWPLGLLLGLALGCSGQQSQILLEVDSDLQVPNGLSRIAVEATSPEGEARTSTAELGAGELPLPRVLALTHRGGALGPYRVSITGFEDGTARVQRDLEISFVSGQVRVLRVFLAGACVGQSCPEGETCSRGSCRPVRVDPGELEPWDGTPPPQDAGDASSCPGIDLETDPMNCGACGFRCEAEGASTACEAGRCVITGCAEGRGDCDGVFANGCETDTTSSFAHCGGCGMSCSPPNRECCAGTCARDC